MAGYLCVGNYKKFSHTWRLGGTACKSVVMIIQIIYSLNSNTSYTGAAVKVKTVVNTKIET